MRLTSEGEGLLEMEGLGLVPMELVKFTGREMLGEGRSGCTFHPEGML